MIDPAPNAPEGSVTTLESYAPTDFTHDDAILCRVTAPLVSMAFGFIRRNMGVRILGKDIGEGLLTLIKKMNAPDVDELEVRLRRWADREEAKLRERGKDQAADNIVDKFTCLKIFIDILPENDRSVATVCKSIQTLFTNNNQGLLTLCTVHKAKGLEWDRVFILDRSKYMPSKWAKQDWERRQERNLIYVAITRARRDLFYINSNQWKSQTQNVANSTT